MKTTIIALFALFTTGYSAMFGIELPDFIFASGSTGEKGGVAGGAAASQTEGAAAGGVDGEGATIGAAQAGNAFFFGLGGPNTGDSIPGGAEPSTGGGFNLQSLFGGAIETPAASAV